MITEIAPVQTNLIGETPIGEFGSVAIRVVVLPRKDKKTGTSQPALLDLEEGELLPETGATPVSSYLEKGKGGKQCSNNLI